MSNKFTYKDAIIKSLSKTEISDYDTGTITEMYPLSFPRFSMGLAALQVHLGETVCNSHTPEPRLDNDKPDNISGSDEQKLEVLKNMMFGINNLSPEVFSFRFSFQRFLVWLLDQPISCEENGRKWCDARTLAEKWNEFIKLQKRYEGHAGEFVLFMTGEKNA